MKTTSIIAMATIAIFSFACQQAEKEETQEVNNEIPVTTSSSEALAQFNLGLELFDIGNNQKSRSYFAKAIELDPNFTSAYIYHSFSSGSAEEFKNDTDKAIETMEKVSEGEKLLAKKNITYIENDSESRMNLMKKLVELYPNSARAHRELGYEYGARNDRKTERAEFTKAIDLKPEGAGAYTDLGLSYLFSEPKDFNKAEEIMAKVVAMIPENSGSHINLGDCYRAQNKLEKARDSYAKAIELNPENATGYYKKGHANSFLGNLEEARTDYQNGRQYDEYKNLTFEAYTYIYEGDVDKALSWIEEQLMDLDQYNLSESRVNSTKLGCINTCSWIAMHNNKVEHIKELIAKRAPISEQVGASLDNETAINNQKATLVYWEGIAAAMEADYETALAKADENKALLEASTNPRKLESNNFLLGYISFKQGNYEESLQQFDKANPNSLYVKYMLSEVNSKLGNTERSIELLEEISKNNFNTVQYAVLRNDVLGKLAAL